MDRSKTNLANYDTCLAVQSVSSFSLTAAHKNIELLTIALKSEQIASFPFAVQSAVAANYNTYFCSVGFELQFGMLLTITSSCSETL